MGREKTLLDISKDTTIQRDHTRHEAILLTMDECKADAVINSIILVSDVTP